MDLAACQSGNTPRCEILTAGPPHGTLPHISVLSHACEHPCHRGLALYLTLVPTPRLGQPTITHYTIGSAYKLPQNCLLTATLELRHSCLQSFLTDGGRNTGRRGAEAVRVHVLVNLICDLVTRVRQVCKEGVASGKSGPGACVGVAFDEDVLGSGTGSTDAVNGSLVERIHKIDVHVVLFVCVEDLWCNY